MDKIMKTTINYKITTLLFVLMAVLLLSACGAKNAAPVSESYPSTGPQVDLSANKLTAKPLKEYLAHQNKFDQDYIFQYKKADNAVDLIPGGDKATEIEEYLDSQLSPADWADYMLDVTQISLAVGAVSPNTSVNVVDPNDTSSYLYSVHNGVVSYSIATDSV